MKNDTNEDNDTSLSPLVTAQDRKRMILERRRKERVEASSSVSCSLTMEANASSSCSRSVVESSHLASKRSETSDATNRRFSSDNNSSLFGAVMQRTSVTPIKGSSAVNNTATTPKPNNAHVSWNDENASTPPSNAATTPSSSRKSFVAANSPGGFALLQMLNSVASPYRHLHERDENDHSQAESPKRRIEEWQEGHLSRDNDAIGVVDWSIKSKLYMECHPDSCLPMMQNWKGAMQYWQYPATTTLPVADSTSATTNEAAKDASSVSMYENVVDLVRGRNALLHRLVHQDPNVWRERRNREWQEAFRSLYVLWMDQVEVLQQDQKKPCHVLTQICFYVMASSDQVVLFRIGMTFNDDKNVSRLVPMVVLSSTTHSMRSKLRLMGVKLHLYHDKEAEYREDEQAVKESGKEPKTKKDEEDNDESAQVDQELEALRRAQAHGETAGADVSIAKKTKLSKSKRIVPPLCIVGEDGVAAFFEFYLNTLGSGETPCWLDSHVELPLLLSRNIGPFSHASLQSLTVVSSRRDAAARDTSNKDDPHASIELSGVILPCALQELIGSTVRRMKQDTKMSSESVRPKRGKDNDDVGSHYFVVEVQTDDGSSTTGSRWLNDGSTQSDLGQEADANECEPGEVVGMIVWDIARPSMIAYKTEEPPGALFGFN